MKHLISDPRTIKIIFTLPNIPHVVIALIHNYDINVSAILAQPYRHVI